MANDKNKVQFARMFYTWSTLMGSGVPVLTAIKVTAEEVPAYGFELGQIHGGIYGGKNVADSMQNFEEVDKGLIELIREEEERGGDLVPGALRKCGDLVRSDLKRIKPDFSEYSGRALEWRDIEANRAYLLFNFIVAGKNKGRGILGDFAQVHDLALREQGYRRMCADSIYAPERLNEILFFDYMATLLEAGVPLPKALNAVEKAAEGSYKMAAGLIETTLRDMKDIDFYTAMTDVRGDRGVPTFSPFELNMVMVVVAGQSERKEECDIIAVGLRRTAEHLQLSSELEGAYQHE